MLQCCKVFRDKLFAHMLTLHKLTFNKCSLNMLSVLKLTQNFIPGFLGWSNTGTTCVRTTWSSAQLWGEFMKIGSTCARTTCVSGSLVTGSTWTLGQLVHGQHELQGHLLHGQHEHWVKLLHGTVVQGRVKVVSAKGCHLKKFTCKETLRQVFIKVYRLELHFNHMLVFLTQLCELLTLQSSFWFNSSPPHPLPCVNKYKVCIQCVKGAWDK